jgi:hypothetical protein
VGVAAAAVSASACSAYPSNPSWSTGSPMHRRVIVVLACTWTSNPNNLHLALLTSALVSLTLPLPVRPNRHHNHKTVGMICCAAVWSQTLCASGRACLCSG